jgi:hypothetical protein
MRPSAIINYMKEWGITSYHVTEHGTVDVNKGVSIPPNLKHIPIKFGKVDGHFRCGGTYLRGGILCSLMNSPVEVTEGFECDHSLIKSLKHGPKLVGGHVDVSYTDITTLEHAPQYIGGDCDCTGTKIASLRNFHVTNTDIVIKGTLHLPKDCAHLLSLALMPGIKYLTLWANKKPRAYLRRTDVIHDIFEWQEKLLDLGLVEQAQL